MVLFSTVMVALFGQEERSAVERELRQTARALALAVDRELDGSLSTLTALAASDLLTRGDVKAFYELARRVRPTQRDWRTIFLVTPGGAVVMNTAMPITASLPSLVDRGYVQEALATAEHQVSGLLRDRVTGETTVISAVPVRRDDRVRYLLAAGQGVRIFGDLFAEQNIAEDWRAAILDQNKKIVARSRNPERFIGEFATPALAARMDQAPEGVMWDHNKEGQPTFAAYSRSPRSGWTVAIGVPAAMVSSASRRSLWMVIAGGATLLLIAIASAVVVGQRIAAPIRGLSDAAQALRHLEPSRASVPSRVREVTEVAERIQEAAALLGRQAEQRDRAEDERAQHLLREREATMRAEFLGQVMQAQEDERARLARELHDGTAQSLAALLLHLRLLREASSVAVMRERVDALEVTVAELLAEVRQIAFALRPAILDDLGLATALERYVESVSDSRGIPVEVSIAGFEGPRLPAPVETGVYRIVQEALNNALQHASATKATVILDRGECTLHLAIDDDGVGFDVAAPRTSSGRRHFGLQSIAERTALLRGLLVIDSAPGRGTSILVEIPVTESADG